MTRAHLARRLRHTDRVSVDGVDPGPARWALSAAAGCASFTRPARRAKTPRLVRLLDKLVGALGLYSANIINSASTWAEFARYPARYRRSMILIEHGLDAPAPAASRDDVRRRFNLPLAQPVLLNVGRLAPQKNQDVLIRALACLPQAHLVVAGAGLKQSAFHEFAVTLGVDDRLHLLGPLPAEDIADLYAAAEPVRVFRRPGKLSGWPSSRPP